MFMPFSWKADEGIIQTCDCAVGLYVLDQVARNFILVQLHQVSRMRRLQPAKR